MAFLEYVVFNGQVKVDLEAEHNLRRAGGRVGEVRVRCRNRRCLDFLRRPFWSHRRQTRNRTAERLKNCSTDFPYTPCMSYRPPKPPQCSTDVGFLLLAEVDVKASVMSRETSYRHPAGSGQWRNTWKSTSGNAPSSVSTG